ncbi:hypothetical protein FHS85_003082 [Rhodoligotrophos appendicifer]|uniref:hypothetical protein n=1 Tax=Rhodoligotrophos appendicifer TaxID=987056 RepID=UPI001186274F|nr:hypothetical protein [Rhodoligotrophos appendicifer]
MKQIPAQLIDAARWVIDLAAGFSSRHDTAPIDTVQRLFHFASTRSALVTQKKLYGYLKERMGMGYPKMFEDEVFSVSIRIANMNIFAASLSDLTIHAVAHVAPSRSEAPARDPMARACYRSGLADNSESVQDLDAPRAWTAAFEQRLAETHWENIAAGASAFTHSPKALVEWAPIAEDLKKYDREIVESSMRFAWNEIREDFRNRTDAPAVLADWYRKPQG